MAYKRAVSPLVGRLFGVDGVELNDDNCEYVVQAIPALPCSEALSELGNDSHGEEDSATESLPPPNDCDDIEELPPAERFDGSDSGLGADMVDERSTSTIQTIASPHNNSQLADDLNEIADFNLRPLKSNLKRKHSDCSKDEEVPTSKKKRRISFDGVTVFYFPRAQGFTCIPSVGGITLGMTSHHSHVQHFTMLEHANEQRKQHRLMLQQIRSQRANSKVRSAPDSRNTTLKVVVDASADADGTANISSDECASDEEEDGEEEEEEEEDDEEEEEEEEEEEDDEEISEIGSESENETDTCIFLQPVSVRKRKTMLKSAGVRRIDTNEKEECKNIRYSREFCGCGCKGYCDPDTCSCSQAGVKCQVDRLNFPCGCQRDNCANSTGRIEFNPVRVRTHFIHTIMRLGLEKKEENQQYDAMRLAGHNSGDANLPWRVNESFATSNGSCTINGRHAITDITTHQPENSFDLYTFRPDWYDTQRQQYEYIPSGSTNSPTITLSYTNDFYPQAFQSINEFHATSSDNYPNNTFMTVLNSQQQQNMLFCSQHSDLAPSTTTTLENDNDEASTQDSESQSCTKTASYQCAALTHHYTDLSQVVNGQIDIQLADFLQFSNSTMTSGSNSLLFSDDTNDQFNGFASTNNNTNALLAKQNFHQPSVTTNHRDAADDSCSTNGSADGDGNGNNSDNLSSVEQQPMHKDKEQEEAVKEDNISEIIKKSISNSNSD